MSAARMDRGNPWMTTRTRSAPMSLPRQVSGRISRSGLIMACKGSPEDLEWLRTVIAWRHTEVEIAILARRRLEELTPA